MAASVRRGTPARMLYLDYDAALVPEGGAEVLHLCAGPLAIGHKEPAGEAFQNAVLRQQGLLNDSDDSTASESGSDDDSSPTTPHGSQIDTDSDKPPPGVSWKKSTKKKDKKAKGQKKDDLYALLGLKQERWMATPKMLKDAYRKVCLEMHPDKRLVGVTDEEEKHKVEEEFKKIQEAFTTLSDPAKRREYDSIDEFDDTLPTDCDSAHFFQVFGPAFRRNARWSVAKHVPDVGDASTPWPEVEKFYNFWYSFRSWREFPHPDEEDVEGAEGREHRRWIERNNSKLREKSKKEEGRRLREFVENANRIDPRCVRRREEERAERERKKDEKEAARRAKFEAEERKKADEEAAKAAAEEAAKAARAEEKASREAAKRLLKKQRQALRAINEGDGSGKLLCDDDLEECTQKMSYEDLKAMCERLAQFGMTRDDQREIAEEEYAQLQSRLAAEARKKEEAKKAAADGLKGAGKLDAAKRLEAMKEWSPEECRMLDKAVARFPVGTPKRWEAVTAYVRTRTLDEVLLMVKHRQGMGAARNRTAEDFKAGQKKRAEVTSDADLRMHAFTDVEVNLVGAAAQALVNPLVASEQEEAVAADDTATDATAPASAAAPAAAPAPDAEPSPAAPAPAAAAPVVPSKPPAAEAPEEPSAAAAAAAPADGDWSEAQALALVKAMKQFGKELGAERWERVAELVPGKSKVQCFKRFKELKEQFKNKKAAVE